MSNIELNRKLLHISSIWIILFISLAKKQVVLVTLGFLALFLIIIEITRTALPLFRGFTNKSLVNFLREKEASSQVTGATFFICGTYLTYLFFSSQITIISLLILILSDSFASFIGINYGKVRFWNKTLEGSTAFFIMTISIITLGNYYYNLHYSILKIFIISLIVSLVELSSAKTHINDNFSIPLTASLAMSYI